MLVLRRAETERGRGPGDDGSGWRSLPGTAREVEAVAKRAAPRSLLRLQGTEASTARLLIELPRARWAHIATHGFFADPKVRSILQPDPKLFAFEGRQRTAGLRNPLVLSGLVLAGANRPAAAVAQADQAGDDLGIVTAEAIAGLPLQDLELVVLSACETGLGLVGGGEGVFGLQRAFHLAGAHNVIASLWKVDDEATAALMDLFYDQLWRQDKPPIEALRAAQLMLYHHPELAGELARARGTPDFDKLVQRPRRPRAPAGRGRAVRTRRTGLRSSSRDGGVDDERVSLPVRPAYSRSSRGRNSRAWRPTTARSSSPTRRIIDPGRDPRETHRIAPDEGLPMCDHRRREGSLPLMLAVAFLTLPILPAILALAARVEDPPKPVTPQDARSWSGKAPN